MLANLRRMLLSLFIVSLFFFISCKNDKIPDGVLNQNEMKSLLKDLHESEAAVFTQSKPDTNSYSLPEYYSYLFKKHNTDSTGFANSMKYYSTKPELLEKIYTEMIDEVNKEQVGIVK